MIGTCRLCLTPNVKLQDSHLIPSWAYKRMRGESGPGLNPNPVKVTGGKAFQTSKQLTEYLLCASCESRFGQREDTVSRLCRQTDGTTPLLSHVRRNPEQALKRVEIGELNAAVDTEGVAFFAVSLVWRADVMKEGHLGSGVNLGERYRDEIRRYLSGQSSFPSHARVLLNILKLQGPITALSTAVTMPKSRRVGARHHHVFLIHGFEFTVLVGGSLPRNSHELCLIHSSTKRVFLTVPEMSGLVAGAMDMGVKAKASRSLSRRREP
jgi:hypothetical protein